MDSFDTYHLLGTQNTPVLCSVLDPEVRREVSMLFHPCQICSLEGEASHRRKYPRYDGVVAPIRQRRGEAMI